MRLFHVCTIANQLDQYKQMKTSFLEAGFHEDLCRYSLFDNSSQNIHDPYQVFNLFHNNTEEPYIIFCHQDIILDQGYEFSHLVAILERLEKLDPKWAIAGNAGVSNRYRLVANLIDPNNTPKWSGKFPQKVHSLDENFLIIKTSSKVCCSQELKGFHFYGIDLCLNAILNKHSCYVIDFCITHLSGGNLNQSFWDAHEAFYKRWRSKFNFCYVNTTTGISMCLSKYDALRTLGSKPDIRSRIFANPILRMLVAPY